MAADREEKTRGLPARCRNDATGEGVEMPRVHRGRLRPSGIGKGCEQNRSRTGKDVEDAALSRVGESERTLGLELGGEEKRVRYPRIACGRHPVAGGVHTRADCRCNRWIFEGGERGKTPGDGGASKPGARVEEPREGCYLGRRGAGRYEGEDAQLEFGLSGHIGIVTQVPEKNQTCLEPP